MKILVIQTAFIGDVILATPLLEHLHASYPSASIDVLVRKGNESLLNNNPFIRNVLTLDKKNKKWTQVLQLIKDIRKEKYDKVINLQRFFTTGLITIMSKATETVGFNKNPFSFLFSIKAEHSITPNKKNTHEVLRNLSLIGYNNHDIIKPKLYPSLKDYECISGDQEYITIAPTSVWETKQFPKEKWIELINNLHDKYKIFLLGGATDTGICRDIKSKSKSQRVEILSGKLSFLESAAIMQKAKMNFVNDSAPLHIASAMNAAVTAIFCSTIPEFGFGPLSDNSHIIETTHKLSCRPCGLHGKKKCPKKHFKCSDISIATIIKESGI